MGFFIWLAAFVLVYGAAINSKLVMLLAFLLIVLGLFREEGKMRDVGKRKK